MKYLLIIAILFFFFSLHAQEKGATPLETRSIKFKPGNTRAVVIGISDYQDNNIPDLQYAHRDAEAFADWLRSSAGGSLPKDNIRFC